MGLIKDFLKNKKEQKNANINLEEENIALKQQIKELNNKIKEIEYLHAEEIAFIDREFLTWYSKQNNASNQQDISLNSKISRQNRETIKEEQQDPLDLETQTEDLEIGDLLND